MVITIASFKGGVGKTTTALHLAAFLQQQQQPTILVDGDANRSALQWARPGKLPFRVCDDREFYIHARNYENIVIDTKARPEREELRALANGCHLLIIPTTPDPLSIEAMMLTVRELTEINMKRWRVLLTIVPPRPSHAGDQARELLFANNVPVFDVNIRRLVAFQNAVLEGTTVAEADRKNNGWMDYESVGHQVLALVHEQGK